MEATQLLIDLPEDYKTSGSYQKAMSEYLEIEKDKTYWPIFICYRSGKNAGFFVSKMFQRQTIETWSTIRIIQ
ncbi:MAG: hypothetical protein M3R27_08965 [Bacteroidota bacterium]|nr:hypothetical protein [Bacteroidota bacterium]